MVLSEIDQIIEDFADAAKKHYDALSVGNSIRANKAAKDLDDLFGKIERIGEVAQESLLSLTNSSDDRIALMASVYSFRYNHEKALDTLDRLSYKQGLLGFTARQAIKRWNEGAWKK